MFLLIQLFFDSCIDLDSTMVLHRQTLKKPEKEKVEKDMKRRAKELKKQQGPYPTKKDLVKPSLSLSSTVASVMSEETQQQAR